MLAVRSTEKQVLTSGVQVARRLLSGPSMQTRTEWLLVVVLAGCGGLDDGLRQATLEVVVPTQVSFAPTYVGVMAETTLVVRARGTGWFRLVGATVDTPGVTVDDAALGQRVDAAQPATIALGWQPASPGSLVAQVTVRLENAPFAVAMVVVGGEALAWPDCDDGNPCTDDAFDASAGSCAQVARTGACDDGSACTHSDTCVVGECLGVAVQCDDANPCTLDGCDPTLGCVHPPAENVCDDGDPCTQDLCDSVAGCSHPTAPNGTSCGERTCSTLHACVVGTCHALDISGVSDGTPCSDGVVCTRDDVCAGGECVGGTPRMSPEVIVSIPTFGGPLSHVVSDGVRFVFTDPDATRIATQDANGQLRVEASLPIRASAPPIMLAPGRFVVATGGTLQVVDATVPAQASVVGSVGVHDEPDIQGLARLGTGVLTVTSLPTGVGENTSLPYPEPPQLLRLVGFASGLPAATHVVDAPYPGRLLDFDVYGDAVVVLSQESQGGAQTLTWMRVGPTGVVLESHQTSLPEPAADASSFLRVSVWGHRVVVQGGALVVTYQAPELAYERSVNLAQMATDVLGDARGFFTVGHEGLYVQDWDGATGQRLFTHGAARVERGGASTQLAVSGVVALPISRDALPEIEAFNLITGPWHGAVTAMTQTAADEVVVGGLMTVGRVRVTEGGLEALEWRLLDHSLAYDRVGILRGASRDVTVAGRFLGSAWFAGPQAALGPECPRPYDLSLIDAALDSTTTFACSGLAPGAPYDVVGGELWGANPLEFGSGSAQLVHIGIATGEVTWGEVHLAEAAYITVRASDDGDSVVVFTLVQEDDLAWGFSARVYGSGDDTPRTVRLSGPGHWDVTDRFAMATAGDALVVGGADGLLVVDVASGAVTDSLVVPAVTPIRIPWMADGRLWTEHSGCAVDMFVCWPDVGVRLVQRGYDLTPHGEVALVSQSVAMLDTGTAALVSTASDLVLIAPACEP